VLTGKMYAGPAHRRALPSTRPPHRPAAPERAEDEQRQ